MQTGDPLAKNRTEEFEDDVFDHFVVPHFLNELSRLSSKKPIVIEGGRGSGKTMLLKYLSHKTQFSRKRKLIPDEYLRNVGLYFKFDTQFMSTLTGQGHDDRYWGSVFEHAMALNLAKEIIDSLSSMAAHPGTLITSTDLAKARIKDLHSFGLPRTMTLDTFRTQIQRRKRDLEFWINNPHKRRPDLLPGVNFLLALIEELKPTFPALLDVTYFMYLDEYENLTEPQQRIINTYLKSSRSPIVFNVAVKRYGMKLKETTSKEQIKQPDDFRVYNVDELIGDNFTTFASEVLLLRLKAKPELKTAIDTKLVQDPDRISERTKSSYEAITSKSIRRLLPELTEHQMALEVFNTENLFSQLVRELAKALKDLSSKINPEEFLDRKLPQATIIIPALLRRRRETPEEILKELHHLKEGKPSKFEGSTNWIQTNFVAAFINLFVPHSRTCPFYGGFGTFVKLSAGNLRHFLELCMQSFKRYNAKEESVDIYNQADSAQVVSNQLLREIRNSGPYGDGLYNFAMALGYLFSLSHRRPGLQKPEVTHFSFKGAKELTSDDAEFLKESLKWNVLLWSTSTKETDPLKTKLSEYMLNPIYAPSFFISYRKKLKLELEIDDFSALRSGSPEKTEAVFRKYEHRWHVHLDELELFGER